jgi:hypothetical protein
MGEFEESAWIVSSLLAVVLLFAGILLVIPAVTFVGILSVVIAACLLIFGKFGPAVEEKKVEANVGRKGNSKRG